jgi:hypothetical protein
LIAQGYAPDPQILKRRGRFKLAVATTIALTIVFFELMWMAPGIGIGFAVVAAPLLAYTLRVTRQYLANETGFRRGMANTGTVILTILGAWIFLFVSFITLIWSVCNVSGR